MKKATTFAEEVVGDLLNEYECKGWLHKFHDQHGKEMWGLTPLGRRALNLPALPNQIQ
jgi:hypothetical protein